MIRQNWINKEDTLALNRQCKHTDVSHATAYSHPHPKSVIENDELIKSLIDQAYNLHRFYGSREMVVHLGRCGHTGNRKRAQLMKMRIMQTKALWGLLYECAIVLPEGAVSRCSASNRNFLRCKTDCSERSLCCNAKPKTPARGHVFSYNHRLQIPMQLRITKIAIIGLGEPNFCCAAPPAVRFERPDTVFLEKIYEKK